MLCIKGDYAFAILHSEAGTHNFRMPGSKKGLRVNIEVTPYIETEVVPHDTDLRVDVYRSLGASCLGSHYVDSSVRITHLPSGIVVESSGERNQLRNRHVAYEYLSGRLYMHGQNALNNSTFIRKYDLDKKQIRDNRLKKTFEYSGEIHEVLPQIFEETLEHRIDSLT